MVDINTNFWNKTRYTLYVPIYDSVARFMASSRKVSIQNLAIQKGESVLIVGAGTGLDLEFIPDSCKITATDLTPFMVSRIKSRKLKPNQEVIAEVMDGMNLSYKDDTFDKVILHAIVAVIPDPIVCLKEVERVLKPGGKIALYDKLLRKNQKASVRRKLFGIFTNIFFSNINRDIYQLLESTKLEVVSDEKADLKGFFRRLILKKLNA